MLENYEGKCKKLCCDGQGMWCAETKTMWANRVGRIKLDQWKRGKQRRRWIGCVIRAVGAREADAEDRQKLERLVCTGDPSNRP